MKHFVFLFGLIVSFSAQAADSTVKIRQGDWEANANSRFNREFDGFWGRNFNVGGSLQYFIWDGFSSGVEANYFKSYGGYKGGSVAPIFTKYLWAKGRWAPYLSLLPLRYTSVNHQRSELSSSARAGVKFFVSDQIAVGSALDYTRMWSPYAFKELALMGTVSFHF